MEWWHVGLGLIVVFAIFNTAHQVGTIRQDIARLGSILNAVRSSLILAAVVKELARETKRRSSCPATSAALYLTF